VYVTGRHLVTADGYTAVVGDLFGARDARAILAEYPASDYPMPGLALATLLTDQGGMVGACSQLPANDAAARGAPVYAYEYAEPSPQVIDGFPFGAHHGADVPSFFDGRWPPEQQSGSGATQAAADGDALAGKLIDSWTTFAHTGEPGHGWRAYDRGSGTALSFAADRIGPVDVARTHNCGFWRGLAVSGGGQ
jgi:para-nitrobenzyl esterase